ncbi:MAG TPA: hypothetical protein VH353_16390 [Caulobacteraceae bacterium]|jgi:hypothetical protein|nr:hypothetical protein [Caulobacteraceae bacterium]
MHTSLYVTIIASAGLSGAVSYFTSRLSQHSQRLIERQIYRGAMLAEIRGLHQRLVEYEEAFSGRVMTGEVSSAQVLTVLLQAGDTVVFNNHASSIGLFDRRTALRIVRFYAGIRSLQGRAVVLSEIVGRPGSAGGEDVMQGHLEFVRRLRRRAYRLIRRQRQTRPRRFRPLFLWTR